MKRLDRASFLSMSSLFGGALVFIYPMYWIERYGTEPEALFLMVHAIIFWAIFLIFQHFRPCAFSVKGIRINRTSIFLIFLIDLILFSFYGWHDDRLSIGASIAAIGRASWLVVVAICSVRYQYTRLLVLLTVVLMIVDESRTYFFACFMVLFYRYPFRLRSWSLFVLIIGMGIGIVALGAFRNSVDTASLSEAFRYGFYGEAYNALRPFVSAWSSLDSIGYPSLEYFIHYALSPMVTVAHKIGLLSYFGLESQQELLLHTLGVPPGTNLAPMAGYHASTDVVPFRELGLLVWGVSLIFWFLVISLFCIRDGQAYLPLGWCISPLLIKATPFNFFNILFYILVVFLFFYFLKRISFKPH